MTCRLNLSRQVSVQDFLSTTHTTHRTLHATLGISELFGRGSRFYFFSPNNVETSPVKTENKKKLQNEWKHWEHFSRNPRMSEEDREVESRRISQEVLPVLPSFQTPFCYIFFLSFSFK